PPPRAVSRRGGGAWPRSRAREGRGGGWGMLASSPAPLGLPAPAGGPRAPGRTPSRGSARPLSAAVPESSAPPRAPAARAAAPGGGRLDREQVIGGGLADLRPLGGGERGEVLVLFRLGRLVLLAHPVQPRLAFCSRRRVPVQPGEVVLWPGV